MDQRYKEDLRNIGHSSITQARNTCENLLLDVFRYGLQSVTNDSTVVQLMYKEDFNTTDAIAAQELQAEILNYNDYVDNIYIINFENYSVLTRWGRYSLDYFYDQDLISFIQGHPASTIPVRYIPRVATVYSGGTSSRTIKERVWTLIFHFSPKGAFVMQVDMEDFMGLLNLSGGSKYVSNFILNDSGVVLAGSDDSSFGVSMVDDPIYQTVRKQPDYEGSLSYYDPDTHNRCTVFYIIDGYLGFTYYSVIQETMLTGGNRLLLEILVLSILFCVLSAVGAVLLSKLAYRPVKSLSSELKLDGDVEGSDEFDRIRAAYKAMQKKNDSLQSTAEALRRIEESQMLLKLCDPKLITQHYSAEQYEAIEASFPYLHYCCVLVSIDEISAAFEAVEELALLKYSTVNMMEELCDGHFVIRSLEYAPNQLLFICNFEELNKPLLRSIAQKVQNILLQHFQASTTVAVGLTISDTDELPNSLASAKEAATQRFTHGSNSVFFYEDSSAESTDEPYPQEEENIILQSARNRNYETTHQELRHFFDILRFYRMESILVHLFRLDMAVSKLEASYRMDQQSLSIDEFQKPGITLDRIYSQFEERLDNVVATAVAQKESNSEKLARRINSMISRELCNPNLSVSSLAEEVGLSVNYLRNSYKAATGVTLSNYITDQRLTLICSLLKSSDLTIQEICDKLGFSTNNYFFTFFKKHMGMTPKQYRMMQGNSSD